MLNFCVCPKVLICSLPCYIYTYTYIIIYQYVYIGTLPKYLYILILHLYLKLNFFFFLARKLEVWQALKPLAARILSFFFCRFRVLFLRLLLFRNIRQSLCRELCSTGTSFFCCSCIFVLSLHLLLLQLCRKSSALRYFV